MLSHREDLKSFAFGTRGIGVVLSLALTHGVGAGKCDAASHSGAKRCAKHPGHDVSLCLGQSKAAICRTFGVKRTTLIETLSRLGR